MGSQRVKFVVTNRLDDIIKYFHAKVVRTFSDEPCEGVANTNVQLMANVMSTKIREQGAGRVG